jgi:hypothetical protein
LNDPVLEDAAILDIVFDIVERVKAMHCSETRPGTEPRRDSSDEHEPEQDRLATSGRGSERADANLRSNPDGGATMEPGHVLDEGAVLRAIGSSSAT